MSESAEAMKSQIPAPWGQPLPARETMHSNSDWRFDHPVWDTSKCVRCGMCFLLCPDSAIARNAEGFYEATPAYCKGCGLCVQQCPTGCISLEPDGNRPPWLSKL
jgi:pyruvate ferredoxin oxidoreductase delta subunit